MDRFFCLVVVVFFLLVHGSLSTSTKADADSDNDEKAISTLEGLWLRLIDNICGAPMLLSAFLWQFRLL